MRRRQMLLDFNAKKNSKFKFSLGSGQRCVLRDLKLDPEFLAKLLPGIPFEVESGVIDQITVHAKLHSIKTEPTLVDIRTVEIIIRECGRGAADAAGAAAASATWQSCQEQLGRGCPSRGARGRHVRLAERIHARWCRYRA